MKTKKNKAVVVVMTAVMLLTSLFSSGCNLRKNKDITDLQNKAEEFVDVFCKGDADEVTELVEDRYAYTIGIAKKKNVLLKIASKTEIEEVKEVEVDRKAGRATVKVMLSYIDIRKFGRDNDNRNITESECIEKIDSYKDRKTSNYTFVFVLNDDGEWVIKKTSAERYENLFNHQYYLSLVLLSADQARNACIDVYTKLAQGDFNQQIFTYNTKELMAFNTFSRKEDAIKDAVKEFAKAYFKYIVDHGITVEAGSTNKQYKISGFAPSKKEILNYYASEEYAIKCNMAVIRAELAGSKDKEEAIWDSFISGVYYDLAKKIPNMQSEGYKATINVTTKNDAPLLQASGKLFPITNEHVLGAPKYTYEQDMAARKKAIQALYDAGELTKEQYDRYMDELTSSGNSTPSPTPANNQNKTTVNWPGVADYKNQAVNVYEYVPEWSDGNLIYGASEPDSNGLFMHYSKEPGWLNTAGYNYSSGQITVMVKFDKKFIKGTKLVYDWEINGQNYQYEIPVTVETTGQTEFWFTIPATFDLKGDNVEFRLWEANHTHVIAYVQLTKT